ncbi:MAG: hypothetical protein R3F20_01630 [Planctomycetota bacterium]
MKPDSREAADLESALRAHGYLESGVQRFLGRPGRTGSRTLFRTAVRAGLLGGPALALGLFALHASGDAHLLEEPARSVRLGLFLLVGATALVGAAAFAASVAARGLAPRGRAFVALGGGAVFAALLGAAWLALREVRPEGRERWGPDLVALLVVLGVAATLALVLALAAQVAAGARGRVGPRRGGVLALVVLGLGAALAVAQGLAPARLEARPSTPFDVVQTGRRVAWIAVDGLDLRAFDEARARGELRGLRAAAERGIVLPLEGAGAGPPPAIWTTAATGCLPARHGIRDTETRRARWGGRGPILDLRDALWPLALEARTEPISAGSRRLPTLAEIVAAKRYRVLSVNAWSSGPSDPDDGIALVSDRATRDLVVSARATPPLDDLRPEDLRRAWVGVAADFDRMERGARKVAVDEALVRLVSDRLDGEGGAPPDLVVLGLTGLDLVALDGDEAARRAQLGHFDATLARLLDRLVVDHAVVLTFGPGFGGRGEDGDGVAILLGEPFAAAPGARLATADLGPLVLRVLGFPTAEDQDGRPPERLLSADFRERVPPRRIATFGDRTRRGPDAEALAREQLDALRTLGYGGGGR